MYKALTFLTHLYALCEQFCATRPPVNKRAGRLPMQFADLITW